VAGSKRERELARAKYERQQAKRAEESAKRRQRTVVATAVVVSVAVVLAIVGIGRLVMSSSDGEPAALPTGSSTPTATGSPSSEASSSPIPTDGSAASCTYSASQDASKPVSVPATKGPTRPSTATATITLNGKPVTVELLRSKAPCTVNSFAHLAAAKYFDGTTCHRLTSGDLSVLQCGDPTGSGSGGPGYTFADENLTGATYPAGTLAMANSGPDTNGSQFFLVYKDSQTLPPAYTPFGKVTAGMDVLQAIAAKGISGGGTDGAPAEPVTVNSIRVKG
jgi:peptidyl-prolyl cis-trans isomerase B (cyclophilin B)